MNHALKSNHLLGSICINPLNHLELRLNLLPSPPHRKNKLLVYRENRPSRYKKSLVEVNVDVTRVRSGRVQLAIFLTTLLVAPLVAFFCRASFALPLLDGKGADLQVVFFSKPAIKQAA